MITTKLLTLKIRQLQKPERQLTYFFSPAGPLSSKLEPNDHTSDVVLWVFPNSVTWLALDYSPILFKEKPDAIIMVTPPDADSRFMELKISYDEQHNIDCVVRHSLQPWAMALVSMQWQAISRSQQVFHLAIFLGDMAPSGCHIVEWWLSRSSVGCCQLHSTQQQAQKTRDIIYSKHQHMGYIVLWCW